MGTTIVIFTELIENASTEQSVNTEP